MAGGTRSKTEAPRRKQATQARVAFAKLIPPTLPPGVSLSDALSQSLVVGTVIDRYNRDWRMGPSQKIEDDVIGRIGFERAAGVAELWDEQLQDFRPSTLREGTTSPFALDTSTQRIAFQRRPGVIERFSFTGALAALLNEASPYQGWDVEPDIRPVAFDAWLEDVGRVTKLLIRIRRPNPDYRGRHLVEEIIEKTNAELISMTVQAAKDDPEGVDVDEPLVAQAIEHVAAGYGYIKAEGTRLEGDVVVPASKFDSQRHGAAPESVVPADPQTKDATPEALRREANAPPDVG